MNEPIVIEVEGIPATIDPRAVRDWRVFSLLAEAEDNPKELLKALPGVMRRMFGAEQFENILESLESKYGYADIETVQRFFIAAMTAAARGNEPAREDDLKN